MAEEKERKSTRHESKSYLTGLRGNDYDVGNWKDFYQLSMKRTEAHLEGAKDKWFEGVYNQWQHANDGVLESHHLDVEWKC